jgi:hypothetical protein
MEVIEGSYRRKLKWTIAAATHLSFLTPYLTPYFTSYLTPET